MTCNVLYSIVASVFVCSNDNESVGIVVVVVFGIAFFFWQSPTAARNFAKTHAPSRLTVYMSSFLFSASTALLSKRCKMPKR